MLILAGARAINQRIELFRYCFWLPNAISHSRLQKSIDGF